MFVWFSQPWLSVFPVNMVFLAERKKVTLDPAIGSPVGSLVCEAKFTVEPGSKLEDGRLDPGIVARRVVSVFFDVVLIFQIPGEGYLKPVRVGTVIWRELWTGCVAYSLVWSGFPLAVVMFSTDCCPATLK